jgi:deoxyribonuclease-4
MSKKFPIKNKKYPLLGAHTSIAGGLFNAIYYGLEIGCNVVQIFSKNQMQWKGKPLSKQEIAKFREAVARTGIIPITVHDSYLINLASPKKTTYNQSFEAFVDELERCEMLQIPYLVMHPGSHLESGEKKGLNKIATSIQKAYQMSGIQRTTVLLETTAGQGTNLGYTFEQLNHIIHKTELEGNIGVCLDTCHVFAAGYDIRTKAAWKKTKKVFDRVIGLEKLKVIHLNDSMKNLGSRVDRHTRIGRGEIGLKGFTHILNDRELREVPMILEIPGGKLAYKKDLKILRGLVRAS